MNNEAETNYAVLTGDVVQSTRLSQSELEAVRARVESAVGEVRGWRRGLVRGKVEFFRGDAWQLLLNDVGRALRVSTYLRAVLLAQGLADTRVSVGLGTVEHISRSRISLSTGEAFVLSGHGLDGMTQYSRLTVVAPESTGALAAWLPVVAHLCDALIRQWTQRQAEIAALALAGDDATHEDISAMLTPPVTKQAVTKALQGAHWHAVRDCVQQFERSPWDVILGKPPAS